MAKLHWVRVAGCLVVLILAVAIWQGSRQPGPTTEPTALSATQAVRLADLFRRSSAFEYDPPQPGTYHLPVIKSAPDARLLNHLGQPVQLQSLLAGKETLLAFVYLNCADAQGCPLAMATLWQIYDGSAERPELREMVQLVTISFDPARDTPEALNNIVQTMAADTKAAQKLNWHFLTSHPAGELKPLLQGFGQPVNQSAAAEQNPGQINHLLRLFLVDRHGNVRNVYGLGSIDPRLIMTDVATLMLQETGNH